MSSSFNDKWWKNGIRFQCQGSGKCCVSRDEAGFVFLTLEDRQRFAKFFKIPTQTFTKKYCQKFHTAFHLSEDPNRPACQFLIKNKCSVYEARPMQCRTWPFWPEVMNAKTWKKEVENFCPGINKGPLHSANEIHKTLVQQKDWEKKILNSQKSKLNSKTK